MPEAIKIRATKDSAKPSETRGNASEKKDPKAPKRGLSAYMFFANEQRDTVKEENPGIKFGQISKVLGAKWRAFNEEQREPYVAKAAADKKRYEAEKADYTSKGGDDDDDDDDSDDGNRVQGDLE